MNAVKATAGGVGPLAALLVYLFHSILINRGQDEKAVGTIFMSIEDELLKKSKHKKYNIYTQVIGILNAQPIISIRSQETSLRLSCIQLLRHGCASNVMKVGRKAFQETSVHRIFLMKAVTCTC